MKTRFILFRRAGVYYCEDTTTRKQTSLRTRDHAEALAVLNAKNESLRQPVLNLQIARAYLSASDSAFLQRTWQDVMNEIQTHGRDSTRIRYVRGMKSRAFDGLRHRKLLETTTGDFYERPQQARPDVCRPLSPAPAQPRLDAWLPAGAPARANTLAQAATGSTPDALRTEELLRLTWKDVWRVPGHIEVTAGKAKTRQRRLVEICPALGGPTSITSSTGGAGAATSTCTNSGTFRVLARRARQPQKVV